MFRARPRWTVSASGLAVPDRAGPARPPTPHFYRQGLGQPGPQALTFIDRARASPAPNHPQPLTFIDRAQASLAWANPSLLLANPSLLLAGPDPSFLLAGLGQVRARRGGQAPAAPRAPGGGQARLTNPLLTLTPGARARAAPPARVASLLGDQKESLR